MVPSNIITLKKLLIKNSKFQRQNQRYKMHREKEQGVILVTCW